MSNKIDMTGRVIGRLLVIEECGRTKGGDVLWRCRCLGKTGDDCGNEVIVSGSDLRRENTTSCGCYRRERAAEANTTHGMSKTRLHSVWIGILTRVGVYKGASEEGKHYYQDRGITVCDEWLIFENFRDWALLHGYKEGLQIDRVNNDAGYCPENCRWVTPKDNANNRRNTLRLSDGTPLAVFCSKVGIETIGKNGKATNQYNRISIAYSRHHRAHPELVEAANRTILEMHQCLELIHLLEDVRAFKSQYLTHKGTWSL